MSANRFPLGPRIRVAVKQEHITEAVAADSSKCWIAEAIKATVPHATAVIVDLATTRFTDATKGLRYVYATPYSAQKALIEFDEGTPPPPFAFVLKNAHVTRAGSLPVEPQLRKKAQTKRQQKDAARRSALHTKLKTTRVIANATGSHGVPRRVGGKRPPQLRMKRMFGIRAFRGASRSRLEADAARAESGR
jgi:hypothetical protein